LSKDLQSDALYILSSIIVSLLIIRRGGMSISLSMSMSVVRKNAHDEHEHGEQA